MKRFDEEQLRRKRRDDDDLDEIEEEQLTQAAKKESSLKKAKNERDLRIVEDFNLLDVPKKVNLKPLFEDFVIPMIPDGYEIKFKPRKTSATSLMGDSRRKSCYVDRIYSIDDIVYQTRQPRALFPTCKTKKVLKVVRPRSNYDLLMSTALGGNEASSEEENDESMYSMGSEQNLSTDKACVYMFSKFMRDLEDLVDVSTPMIEKKIEEMVSNLSMKSEVSNGKKSKGIDRKESGISLSKNVKKDVLDDLEDSDDDSREDTDDEDENKEIARNTTIDKLVKDANMYRCTGRWSTRDIHDVKFNEDRLTIQFRTGRLGLFALATNRYCNFPFQSWDIKPDLKV